MIVDRKWTERNLGFDPIAKPAPVSTFSFTPAAHSTDSEDLRREIIDFDSEAPEGREFLAFTTATGLSRFTEVPWPKGLEPETSKVPHKGAGGRLPRADVLVVTWTVDEGHALSRVLTPGKDSRNDYKPYTRNFGTISKKMQIGKRTIGLPSTGNRKKCKAEKMLAIRLSLVLSGPAIHSIPTFEVVSNYQRSRKMILPMINSYVA